MLIYIIIAVILSIAPKSGKKANLWNRSTILALASMGLLRGEPVGVDVRKYIINIQHTTFAPSSWNFYTVFEPGYNLLIAAFNSVFDYPMLFIGLTNVLYVISFNKFAKSKSRDFNLFILLLFLLGYYTQSYNIMRQYFAISIFLLYAAHVDIGHLTKKQFIMTFLLILFLGMFFHNSTYIMFFLLLYNIPTIRTNVKKAHLCILLIFTYFMTYLQVVRQLLQPLTTFFLLNDKTNTYFNSAMNADNITEEYSIIRLTFDTLFALFILYKASKVDVYVFCYIIGQIYLNFSSSLNPLFTRLSSWMFIIGIVALCNLYNQSKLDRKVIILYCTIIFINNLLKNYGGTIPYVLNI